MYTRVQSKMAFTATRMSRLERSIAFIDCGEEESEESKVSLSLLSESPCGRRWVRYDNDVSRAVLRYVVICLSTTGQVMDELSVGRTERA
jgi:hypothetical protein